MLKFPPPPEPPTGPENYLQELALYYERLKEYYDKASQLAATQLKYVEALLNPKLDIFEELATSNSSDDDQLGNSSLDNAPDDPEISDESKAFSTTHSYEEASDILIPAQPGAIGGSLELDNRENNNSIQVIEIADTEPSNEDSFPLDLESPSENLIPSASDWQSTTLPFESVVILRPELREINDYSDHKTDIEVANIPTPAVVQKNLTTDLSDRSLTSLVIDEKEHLEGELLANGLSNVDPPPNNLESVTVSNEESPTAFYTQQIEHLLQHRRGQLVHLDFIVRKLYGVIEQSQLSTRTAELAEILKTGEKEGRWFKMPDSPDCWTIDLKEFPDLINNSLPDLEEDKLEEFFPTPVMCDRLKRSTSWITEKVKAYPDLFEVGQHYYKNKQGHYYWSKKALAVFKKLISSKNKRK